MVKSSCGMGVEELKIICFFLRLNGSFSSSKLRHYEMIKSSHIPIYHRIITFLCLQSVSLYLIQ